MQGLPALLPAFSANIERGWREEKEPETKRERKRDKDEEMGDNGFDRICNPIRWFRYVIDV